MFAPAQAQWGAWACTDSYTPDGNGWLSWMNIYTINETPIELPAPAEPPTEEPTTPTEPAQPAQPSEPEQPAEPE